MARRRGETTRRDEARRDEGRRVTRSEWTHSDVVTTTALLQVGTALGTRLDAVLLLPTRIGERMTGELLLVFVTADSLMVGDFAVRADLDEAHGTANAHTVSGAVERRAIRRWAVDKLVRACMDVREERGAEKALVVVWCQQPLDRVFIRDRLRAPGRDAHTGRDHSA